MGTGACSRSQNGGKRRTNYNVTAQDFIETWNRCDCADDVAKELGMPKPIVFSRASEYRNKGIKLKKMPRVHGLDVDKLNRDIEELQRKHNIPSACVKKAPKQKNREPQQSYSIVAGVVGSLPQRKPK